MARRNTAPTRERPGRWQGLGFVDTQVIYCGANIDKLRELPGECVDLIYIDPPFNSNRNYEVFWGGSRSRE
jgi:16S rRNA G966 N2-methylase RsmD